MGPRNAAVTGRALLAFPSKSEHTTAGQSAHFRCVVVPASTGTPVEMHSPTDTGPRGPRRRCGGLSFSLLRSPNLLHILSARNLDGSVGDGEGWLRRKLATTLTFLPLLPVPPHAFSPARVGEAWTCAPGRERHLGDNRGLRTSGFTSGSWGCSSPLNPLDAAQARPHRAKRDGQAAIDSLMLHRCESLTKKKRPCPNNAEAQDENGRWLCHVHHPWGVYQLQLIDRRKQRQERGR